MNFYNIAIDHKSANLSLREQIIRRRGEISDLVYRLDETAAVLFTCNRAEIFSETNSHARAKSILKSLRCRFPAFFFKAELRWGLSTVEHALRLACGLESQIMGEEQILEQIKLWFNRMKSRGGLWLFWNKVLARSMPIRKELGLDKQILSLADIVFNEMRVDKSKEAIIIGTGALAQSFVDRRPAGFILHFISRKKHSRARRLAKNSNGQVYFLKDLPSLLEDKQIIISATTSPHYIITRSMLIGVKGKLNLYDLALPRDVEPDVATIGNIRLYNLDDLCSRYEIKADKNLIEKEAEVIYESMFKSGYPAKPACLFPAQRG